MAINANSHPYKVVVGDGTSPIYANRHPIKVEIEGGVVTPAEFEELEKKVDALATDLSYKGGVPTYDDLPADPEQGDVYTVEDTGILYVWDGDEWIALNDTDSSTTETLTIADTDWSALSSSDPYTYSATVSVTATIGANSTVSLINDAAVDFATYGFAIGSVDQPNNTITLYSIGAPSASKSLTINIKG